MRKEGEGRMEEKMGRMERKGKEKRKGRWGGYRGEGRKKMRGEGEGREGRRGGEKAIGAENRREEGKKGGLKENEGEIEKENGKERGWDEKWEGGRERKREGELDRGIVQISPKQQANNPRKNHQRTYDTLERANTKRRTTVHLYSSLFSSAISVHD